MANLDAPGVRIQFLIDRDTNLGRFHDALYFSRAEYQALTNQEVGALAQARVDAWKESIRAARQNARQATRAERIAEREAMAAQLATLDAEIAVMPDVPV